MDTKKAAEVLATWEGSASVKSTQKKDAGTAARKAAGVKSKRRKPGDKTTNAARAAAGLD